MVRGIGQGSDVSVTQRVEALVKDRLGGLRLALPERQEAVREFSRVGLSQAAQARALGVSRDTIQRQQRQGADIGTQVTGRDGKTYPAHIAQPRRTDSDALEGVVVASEPRATEDRRDLQALRVAHDEGLPVSDDLLRRINDQRIREAERLLRGVEGGHYDHSGLSRVGAALDDLRSRADALVTLRRVLGAEPMDNREDHQ